MTMKDDNELVYEVIHGSISSFEVLVDRYQKTIFNLMLQMAGDFETARDLTQDVFVKAFEKMGGFDFRFRFFSWIYRIAVNEGINWSRKRFPSESLENVERLPVDTAGANGSEIRNRLLHRELRKLEANYRVMLLLKYYCGLSYEEIAEATCIPVKKVRSRLFIAREQMRKGLIANGFFEHDR
jgi:RNA polymerase sigma-70 factor (ECF subfamily)